MMRRAFLRDGVRRVALLALVGIAACGPARSTRVVIAPGSFRSATDSLVAARVISFGPVFRLYARARGLDRRIQAGTYVFKPGASWGDVLRDLNEGRDIELTVTVPEGLPLAQSLPLIAEKLDVPLDSLEMAVRDRDALIRAGTPAETLEGYLFPDTYRFPPDANAESIVDEMLKRFEAQWTPAMTARLDSTRLSRHAIITLASIVEEEARVDSERPVIAAVYLNRIAKRMPLQADPTVRYALGKYSDRVLYRDLKVESPYNTYRVRGLPPGPIAAPGRKSLEAALWPATVPWLFFVAHPDGHHLFSRTFREHSRAIRAVKALRAEQSARAATRSEGPA